MSKGKHFTQPPYASGNSSDPLSNFVHDFLTSDDGRELLEEFDRLRGTNLSLKGTALELQIDQSSGRWEHDAKLFAEFFRECVLERIKPG